MQVNAAGAVSCQREPLETLDMEFVWLYSLCQCIVSVSVIAVSVRLCIAVSGNNTVTDAQGRTQGARIQQGSVSRSLRLCLAWVGAAGGAIGVPVTVVLNLRTPQCLYTCITLVCFPILLRQFTMFLSILLTLDTHLQLHLADRYHSVITCQRALCAVLLCWVGSVLSSFGQFIGSDDLDFWRSNGAGMDTAGLGLHSNWTTSLPHVTTSPPPKYYQEREVIGSDLPYGGFLSKFYVEDTGNYTYAQIHSSHWVVCAHDTILSPQFLVYVYAVMVFVIPLLCLLAIYLDLICIRPRKTPFGHTDPPKHDSSHVRSLTLSLFLLVVLCMPLHIIHALGLFIPRTKIPRWSHSVAVVLIEVYSLVPPILFTPPKKQVEGERASFPLSVSPFPAAVTPSGGKSVCIALCGAVQAAQWSSAKHSLKAKVCPEV